MGAYHKKLLPAMPLSSAHAAPWPGIGPRTNHGDRDATPWTSASGFFQKKNTTSASGCLQCTSCLLPRRPLALLVSPSAPLTYPVNLQPHPLLRRYQPPASCLCLQLFCRIFFLWGEEFYSIINNLLANMLVRCYRWIINEYIITPITLIVILLKMWSNIYILCYVLNN